MPALQVRDVPDELARVLTQRAARSGQSLSEYRYSPVSGNSANNLSAYAATYVALTEALDAALLTADARLADAVNRRATCATTLLRPPRPVTR
jgi:predicted nucleic acid-binding protein